MTSLIRETDILPVVGYQIDDYANWFERGFRALSSADVKVVGRAFSPLHNVLAISRSHIEGLERIYRVLPEETPAKEHFRRGLVVAFGRLSRGAVPPLSQLGDILNLCQLIQADELAPILLPFFADIGVSANDNLLFRQALTYLASLSGYDNTAGIVHGLLTLPDSLPSYSVFGWLTMCRCDPENWSKHLGSLRNKISQALKEYSGTNNVITAARFAAFMPLSEVANHLSSLQYSRNRVLGKQADNWLLNALVGEDHSPYVILCDQDGNLFLNHNGADNDAREPIAEPSEFSALNTDTNWFLNHIAQNMKTQPERERISPRQNVMEDIATVKQWIARFGLFGPVGLSTQGAC